MPSWQCQLYKRLIKFVLKAWDNFLLDIYGANCLILKFNEILKVSDSRVLLYAGDVDMACNFLGGEMFAEALKLPVIILF